MHLNILHVFHNSTFMKTDILFSFCNYGDQYSNQSFDTTKGHERCLNGTDMYNC